MLELYITQSEKQMNDILGKLKDIQSLVIGYSDNIKKVRSLVDGAESKVREGIEAQKKVDDAKVAMADLKKQLNEMEEKTKNIRIEREAIDARKRLLDEKEQLLQLETKRLDTLNKQITQIFSKKP